METRVQALASQSGDDGGAISVDTLIRLKAVEAPSAQLESTLGNLERRLGGIERQSESALKIARDARGKVSGVEKHPLRTRQPAGQSRRR